MSSTDFAGLSAVSAYWKTICISRNWSWLRLRGTLQFLAIENDVAWRRRMDAGDDARQRRFSAAGFADDAEIAPLLDDQADLIDRAEKWQSVSPHRA